MSASAAEEFRDAAKAFAGLLRTAKRNRASLATHRYYAPKARAGLARLRKSFLVLKRDFPEERFSRVAFQLTTIEPLVSKLVELFPDDLGEMAQLIDEINFKTDSDLAAELESPLAAPTLSTTAPFLPDDLIDAHHGVHKKILWEANRCYDAACYNACAAMIRRLVEGLIIDAFEHRDIGNKIKHGNDYVEFGALIGKAAAEPVLRLTRNTKRVLPELKFFGDLGAHNRMALVRKGDLDRLHNAIRGAIEEVMRSV